MIFSRPAIAFLAAASLAACAQTAPDPAPYTPPAPAGGCRAEAAQFAVGQPYSESLAQEARMRSGATRVRPLRPGQAVTMEFSAERLNLHLDAGDRVTAARCG